MCITLTLTERWRRVLGLTTTVTNMVIVILCICLLVAAIAIKRKLDSRLELLEDYDAGALPIYLSVTACLLFVVHGVAVRVCCNATYPATRSPNHHYFIGLMVVMAVMTLYLFICFIVTLAHSNKLWYALEAGMTNSMKVYKSDPVRKQRVDSIQVEFECCGHRSYTDWLKTPWINVAFVDMTSPDITPFIKKGEYIKDDVPFSCCSRFAKRACVHHSIKTENAHRNYQVGDTLYPEGCTDVMTSYFHSGIIAPTSILIIVMVILQILTITMMRYLQTSIENAKEMNDPEGDGAAYCLRSGGVEGM